VTVVYVIRDVVLLLCELLIFAIFFRSMLSWFAPRQSNTFTRMLDRVTDPILSPLRRIVPTAGMVDFTPFIAILILGVLSWVIQMVL
jgi:YggT family protein